MTDATVPVTSEVYKPYTVNVIDRADSSVLYTGTINLVNTLGGATLKSGCTGCASGGNDHDGVALEISGTSANVNAEYRATDSTRFRARLTRPLSPIMGQQDIWRM